MVILPEDNASSTIVAAASDVSSSSCIATPSSPSGATSVSSPASEKRRPMKKRKSLHLESPSSDYEASSDTNNKKAARDVSGSSDDDCGQGEQRKKASMSTSINLLHGFGSASPKIKMDMDSSAHSTSDLSPQINDVLMGIMGGNNSKSSSSSTSTFFHHIGNRRFRVLVEANLSNYFSEITTPEQLQSILDEGSTEGRKQQEVVENVIKSIQGNLPPGRFLIQLPQPQGDGEEKKSSGSSSEEEEPSDSNSKNIEGPWKLASEEEVATKVHSTFLAAGRFHVKTNLALAAATAAASSPSPQAQDVSQPRPQDVSQPQAPPRARAQDVMVSHSPSSSSTLAQKLMEGGADSKKAAELKALKEQQGSQEAVVKSTIEAASSTAKMDVDVDTSKTVLTSITSARSSSPLPTTASPSTTISNTNSTSINKTAPKAGDDDCEYSKAIFDIMSKKLPAKTNQNNEQAVNVNNAATTSTSKWASASALEEALHMTINTNTNGAAAANLKLRSGSVTSSTTSNNNNNNTTINISEIDYLAMESMRINAMLLRGKDDANANAVGVASSQQSQQQRTLASLVPNYFPSRSTSRKSPPAAAAIAIAGATTEMAAQQALQLMRRLSQDNTKNNLGINNNGYSGRGSLPTSIDELYKNASASTASRPSSSSPSSETSPPASSRNSSSEGSVSASDNQALLLAAAAMMPKRGSFQLPGVASSAMMPKRGSIRAKRASMPVSASAPVSPNGNQALLAAAAAMMPRRGSTTSMSRRGSVRRVGRKTGGSATSSLAAAANTVALLSDTQLQCPQRVEVFLTLPIDRFFVEDDNTASVNSGSDPVPPPSTSSSYIIPSNYDVLCGQGQNFFHHVGNRRFRITIEMNVPRYEEAYMASMANTPDAASGDDDHTTQKLIDEMLNSLSKCDPPGRFLGMEMSTGKWKVLNPIFCQMKTEQTFFECLQVKQRRHARAEQQQEQDDEQHRRQVQEADKRTKEEEWKGRVEAEKEVLMMELEGRMMANGVLDGSSARSATAAAAIQQLPAAPQQQQLALAHHKASRRVSTCSASDSANNCATAGASCPLRGTLPLLAANEGEDIALLQSQAKELLKRRQSAPMGVLTDGCYQTATAQGIVTTSNPLTNEELKAMAMNEIVKRFSQEHRSSEASRALLQHFGGNATTTLPQEVVAAAAAAQGGGAQRRSTLPILSPLSSFSDSFSTSRVINNSGGGAPGGFGRSSFTMMPKRGSHMSCESNDSMQSYSGQHHPPQGVASMMGAQRRPSQVVTERRPSQIIASATRIDGSTSEQQQQQQHNYPLNDLLDVVGGMMMMRQRRKSS